MKKQLKSLLLVTLLVSYCVPSLAQSTQGKEFWVSSSIVCSPAKDKGIVPYIAISAEKACTVHIQGGVGNAINITQNVAAGSWNEFGNSNKAYNTDASKGLINVQMDASKWYPVNTKEPATVCSLAGQKNMYGLHITANENISVYVILSGESAMDASNILPLTALGAEYYTQDFKPEAHNEKSWSTNEGNMVTVTTILATEDNTHVDITPKSTTYDGHASGVLYTIDLNKGETYYLISQKEQQLAGTHIVARDGKKIAIYTGSPLTRLPNGVSARDALFEQPLPVEFWGTQFIITRSLGKNGNIIGITATKDGTEIKLDGYSQNPAIYINEGETYYIVLQNAGDPQANKPGTSHVDKVVTGDALFIETTCPCAVYNYDTGGGYIGKGKDASGQTIDEIEERDGKPLGDCSSVWVSPIQQKIGKITFGTCYTDMTWDHFLNIIAETATCQQTKLTAIYGVSQLDKTNLLTWTPVPGNSAYSYARAKIGDNGTRNFSVFRLENTHGFIATVYGNGKNESYAYSAGSAAVQLGVNVEGETFTEGFRSDSKFCLNTDLSFDAKVGTDEITSVDWIFGDGTSETGSLPQTTHRYTSPGWYDLTAELFGHQVCTDESNVHLGTVHFSFRVVRPDTVYAAPEHRCIEADSTYNGKKLTPYEIDSMLTQGGNETIQVSCADTVYITPISYGMNTIQVMDTIEHEDFAVGYNGVTYYSSQDVIDTIEPPLNSKNCTVYRKYYVKVIACAKITVTNDSAKQHICPGGTLDIEYTKNGGDIKSARFVIPGVMDEEITIPNYDSPTPRLLSLPTASITKPGIYKGQLIVEDGYYKCDDKVFDIDIAVYYPSDIVLYKFNNVLAVYKKGFGGNVDYDFKAYQWYLNYMPIEGATESVLYLGDNVQFEIGDVVYVALTDMKGVTLPSCGQTILNVPDYNIPEEPEQAPARKRLINNRFVIEQGSHTYDIYGQKVK